ncbi:MAG: FMN-binding negative transcriptional regulator [Gammaproteobacteria bacterium]|nr:FMN-binding negative transcriptional regulator [Gammaproteobacteria bacterium]
MHIPKHFIVTNQNEIQSFIESNAFGQLISNSGGRPVSTHIPFLLSDDKTRLLGHLARINPQLRDIEGQEVLVTLQGAHDYISPSWYAGSGVPTWNYQAVHIYGQCRVFNDPAKLKRVVDTLTDKYESGFSTPWQPEYNAAMLGAISGIEICISEIQCQYKLSQNRSAQDRTQVIQQLKANGSTQLAEAMQRDYSENN